MATAQQIRDAATAAIAPATPVVAPAESELAAQLAAANRLIADLQTQLAPAVPAVSETRIYHSALPFIKVPIMRAPGHCVPVQFIAGSLETSDPAVIEVLEAAIAAGGSGFTHAVNKVVSEEEELMRADLAGVASAAHAKMLAAGEKTA